MEALEGKVVLVTGSARRIGRSVALALAEQGAQAAIHYRGSEAEARETAALCGGQSFQADLADVGQIERLFEEVLAAYGRLDGLVNNAAVYRRMPIETTTAEDWDGLHAANLRAPYFCCREAARIMRAQPEGGRIVNLSSLGGLRPWAGYAPYNASKAGVIHMTRSLSKELAPDISVNSVAPGVIEFSDEHAPEVQRQIDATPMGRHGTGAEIAEAVLFFLRCTKFITGQVLAVDGGLSQRA
ncbi:MAG: SDR family oxidoreductase [Acidobacteria bacterium]|nr:SDR family oxidoreductase [Acidobacteriota bacterium]